MITIYENNGNQNADKAVNKKEKIDFPNISEHKHKQNSKLSPYIVNFLEEYERRLSDKGVNVTQKVKVSEVLGKLARLYERIRTTIEYKGEHVLRRNAIERILKRLVWEQENIRADVNTNHVAEALIKEMIWARYLENNNVPTSKVKEVQLIIEKYVYLLRNLDNTPKEVNSNKVRSWIWGVASSELEDLLDPSNRELFINLMYEWFTSYFKWRDSEPDNHEKQIQIYLAIHRAYPKSDDSIMRYHLLLREFPDWYKADKDEVNQFILAFPKIYREIERHLNYPERFKLYRKVQKEVAAFEIFHEVASKNKINLRPLLEDENTFKKEVVNICEEKYLQIKKKVNTGIVRSIIYIFVTKVFLALLLEVPYEIIRFNEVRYLPLTINIMLPPVFMWVIGFSIRVPGAKNTQSILDRLASVIYRNENIEPINFSILKNKGRSSMSNIFSVLYGLVIIGVFGGISYLLFNIGFTIVGVGVFFIFLSLVMLFAFRIRFNANELKVDTDNEGFIDHLVSYLTLPFLNLGFFLSRGLSKLNFLTIILDFLIEAPLKNVIEIFEEWTSFLRQKKEEVVEIPDQ
jgi:hypothetical protein